MKRFSSLRDGPVGAVPGDDYDVYWFGEGTQVRMTVVDVGGEGGPVGGRVAGGSAGNGLMLSVL